MVGISTTGGTVLKGCSLRKVKNHWPRVKAEAQGTENHPGRRERAGKGKIATSLSSQPAESSDSTEQHFSQQK